MVDEVKGTVEETVKEISPEATQLPVNQNPINAIKTNVKAPVVETPVTETPAAAAPATAAELAAAVQAELLVAPVKADVSIVPSNSIIDDHFIEALTAFKQETNEHIHKPMAHTKLYAQLYNVFTGNSYELVNECITNFCEFIRNNSPLFSDDYMNAYIDMASLSNEQRSTYSMFIQLLNIIALNPAPTVKKILNWKDIVRQMNVRNSEMIVSYFQRYLQENNMMGLTTK